MTIAMPVAADQAPPPSGPRPNGPTSVESETTREWRAAWQRELEAAQAGNWFLGPLPAPTWTPVTRPALPDPSPNAWVLRAEPPPGGEPRFDHAGQHPRPTDVAAPARLPLDGSTSAANAASVADSWATNKPPIEARGGVSRLHDQLVPIAATPPPSSTGSELAPTERQGRSPVLQFDPKPDADQGNGPSATASTMPSMAAIQPGMNRLATDEPQAASGSPSTAGTSQPAAPNAPGSGAMPSGSQPMSAELPAVPLRGSEKPPPPAGKVAPATSMPPQGGGSPQARSESAEPAAPTAEATSAPPASSTIARSIAQALNLREQPRLHLSVMGQDAQVWLGVNGSPEVAGLVQTVQRILRRQGLTLSVLTCNGKCIFEARPIGKTGSGVASQEY